ncbi:MAG: FtsX-like permease family protein [Treponema sp.]|nr:FtsX-like permease family protein [Treponema sp.]
MYQLKLALRSLFFRKSQYRSLFLVCMFGVSVSLSAIFISEGMIDAMNMKAKIYYGGNFAFMEDSLEDGLGMENFMEKYEKVRSVFPKDADVSYRFDLDGRSSSYFFEGAQALQQTIKGCNFELEKNLFDNMKFVDGGFSDMNGTNGVLISKPIAESLNVHVGDSMTYMVKTYDDAINTVDVQVKGIFQDSSVFGMYTSYMDFSFLKSAYGRPETFANRIVINFPGKYLDRKQSEKYQTELEKLFPMYRLVDDKSDFIGRDDGPEIAFALIPLSANLTDVNVMERAMDAVIFFIIAVLVVIIVAGIGSTYRILVIKRLNEIGIYMAIGMKKKDISLTLLLESLVLLLVGCVSACLLSFVFCFVVSKFNFSFIPSFDIFLIKGNLSPSVNVIWGVTVIVAVISFTLLAVFYSAWKSIKVLPVKALATVE